MPQLNTDTSVVDFLKSTKKDASFSSRAKLATEQGIVKNPAQYRGTAAQNTSLLQKLRTPKVDKPTEVNTPEQATDFINSKQTEDIATVEETNEPPTRSVSPGTNLIDTFKQVTGRESVLPSAALPEAPNFEQSFADLRKQYGVDDIETTINDLDAQEQELEAQLRTNISAEKGKPVAMNVIQGRVSEQVENMRESLEFVQRQKQRAINELQTANDAIENMMNFRKMDYDVAKDRYNTEFSQNLQLFNTVKGIEQFEATEENRAQDNARANLQIIYNSLKEGQVTAETMDDTTKTKVNKMELQAGLPQGFYENIVAEKPEAKVLSTTTRSVGGVKYADVLYRNPDGSLTTESVRIGASGSSSRNTSEQAGEPEVPFDTYINAAQEELGMSIDTNSQLYKDLQKQWKIDYPSTSTIGFTDSELKRLEAVDLLDAPRQEQLNYLYPPKNNSSVSNPFG